MQRMSVLASISWQAAPPNVSRSSPYLSQTEAHQCNSQAHYGELILISGLVSTDEQILPLVS